jgi:chromosome segregation ATPase
MYANHPLLQQLQKEAEELRAQVALQKTKEESAKSKLASVKSDISYYENQCASLKSKELTLLHNIDSYNKNIAQEAALIETTNKQISLVDNIRQELEIGYSKYQGMLEKTSSIPLIEQNQTLNKNLLTDGSETKEKDNIFDSEENLEAHGSSYLRLPSNEGGSTLTTESHNCLGSTESITDLV